ncbi:MAG TPA: prepilin-type N-terminal cleavage/methylation domain-containing protein [Candidatus Saccharimonadia bacterium]|nr:prepilin-type N-terminal cleavage/methylation domain-containing protein [Candidatus Saccharimonadia bacterium]
MTVVHNQSGFSLIELLVVVALFAIISIAAVSLFLSTLRGSNVTNASAVIKQTGNYALDVMSYMVRDAQQITGCDSVAGTLTLLNRDGGTTQFFINNTNQIASNSAAASITTNNVRVNPSDSDLAGTLPAFVTCSPAVNPTTVTIRFVIRKGTKGVDNDTDIVTQTFGTTVGLRRY